MNERQRYMKTLLFGEADRIPLFPGWGRESMRARWCKEGLTEGLVDPHDVTVEAYRAAGGEPELPKYGQLFRINERMILK